MGAVLGPRRAGGDLDMKRPEAVVEIYDVWRKTSNDAINVNFEGCAWFQIDGGCARKNSDGNRIVIYEKSRSVAFTKNPAMTGKQK